MASNESERGIQRLPEPFAGAGYTAEAVLTAAECEELIQKIDDTTPIDVEESGVRRIVERKRIALTEELSSLLVSRLWLPSTVTIDHFDEHLGPFAEGVWEFAGLHPSAQLYRYSAGGVFSQHRDGPIYTGPDERSFYTVLVYLNDQYEGGRTTVFADDLSSSHAACAGLGSAFVMLQRTLHEGSPVVAGQKLAFRFDVLYRRAATGPQAAACLHGLSSKEQAQRWLQLASALEDSRLSDQAWPFYQRAYHLDPALEQSNE